MERMTRAQAVSLHQSMWKWIAEKTQETGVCMDAQDFLSAFWREYRAGDGWIRVRYNCFLCEFAAGDCAACPFRAGLSCGERGGIFGWWMRAYQKKDAQAAAALAEKIAELPQA